MPDQPQFQPVPKPEDFVDQPTEPHDAISQVTVDEVKAALQDPEVKAALADPTIQNVFTAATDPSVGAVLKDVPLVVTETRAGWKTTEFWVAVAGLLALNLNGVIMTLPDKYQALGTAALAGLYAFSRGLAKQGVPAVDPAAPEA